MSKDLEKLMKLAPDDKYLKRNVGGLSLEDYVKPVNKEYLKHKENCKDYNITKIEFFVYALMIGTFSREIQKPLARGDKPNKFIKECHKLFDSFLTKTPKTKHEIVCRKEQYAPLCSFEESYKSKKPILYQHYLTGSKDDFKHELQLVITPLPNGITKAHDVYLFYNHGMESDNGEYQINFERNTSFIVDKIEKRNNTNYVYCHEI